MKETTRRWLTGVPSTYDGARVKRMYRPLDFREDGRAMLHPPFAALGTLPKRGSGHPDLAQTWLLFQQYWRRLRWTRRYWWMAIAINMVVYLGAIVDLDLGPRLQGLVLVGTGLAVSYVLAILVMVRARRLAEGDHAGRLYASPPEGAPGTHG